MLQDGILRPVLKQTASFGASGFPLLNRLLGFNTSYTCVQNQMMQFFDCCADTGFSRTEQIEGNLQCILYHTSFRSLGTITTPQVPSKEIAGNGFSLAKSPASLLLASSVTSHLHRFPND